MESYCGQSGVDSCSAVADSVPWNSGQPVVFFVLAAFPPESSPLLKGVSFGVDYDPTKFVVMAYGTCADFELPDNAWPDPGTGTAQSWNTTRTGLLTEAYWFVGYGYSEESSDTTSFAVIPHPTQGGLFADDNDPREEDEIAAYGRLGFGTAGALPCPTGGGDMVWVQGGESASEDGQGEDLDLVEGGGDLFNGLYLTGELTFVQLNSQSAATYATIYRSLRDKYRLRVLLGIMPDALICDTESFQRDSLSLEQDVDLVTVDSLPRAPDGLLPGDPEHAQEIWNRLLRPRPRDSTPAPLLEDIDGPFVEEDSLLTFAEKDRQTSMYMMGDVGVSLLFIESDSTGPGSCYTGPGGLAVTVEDWTSDELSLATANLARGLLRLTALAPPGAHLTFSLQDTIVTVPEEPIRVPGSGLAWKTHAMLALGIPQANYREQIFRLNNRQRAALGWDWWLTTFVVRDVCDADYNFPEGSFPCGYAERGSVTLTYYCGVPNANNLWLIPPHEICHVFGAADEYPTALGCDSTNDCPVEYGYLQEPNSNCALCAGPLDTMCVMWHLKDNFAICPSTAGQLGWKDTDEDGICDPIDHPWSSASMVVGGDGDSVRIGDRVDIYQGSDWVRRLAASSRTTDEGRMLWDGIDRNGDPLTPGSGYSWVRNDNTPSPHAVALLPDTLAPVISDLMIFPGGEGTGMGQGTDTLSFRFVDADTHAGNVRAIASRDALGWEVPIIQDQFLTERQSGDAPITRSYARSFGGLWTVTLRVWDVGGGHETQADSSYWISVPEAVGDRRTFVPELALSRSRPNPSSDWVAWDIERPIAGKADLRVVNVDGRSVRSWTAKILPAGATRILWDGRDSRGARVASGRYFLVVDDTGRTRTSTATVIR